jgi:HK97 gp10 family phage protein
MILIRSKPSIELKLNDGNSIDLSALNSFVQEEVIRKGVAAAAKVFYEEVKLNASPPRMGKVTGNLEKSIYYKWRKDASTGNKKVYRIGWDSRIAPHGHLLEFGTVTNPAYPFVRPAYVSKLKEAQQAAINKMREVMREGK